MGAKLQKYVRFDYTATMLIKLYHPSRELSFVGPKPVTSILAKLGLSREAHLVIYKDELVTEDKVIPDDAMIEIRPVISGGTFFELTSLF